jgi:hypothetical protein
MLRLLLQSVLCLAVLTILTGLGSRTIRRPELTNGGDCG